MGKDHTVKNDDQGFLNPTAGEPFVDMKLTLKAQPKKEVVSFALLLIGGNLGNGSEQNR